jgi:hypothetical protein
MSSQKASQTAQQLSPKTSTPSTNIFYLSTLYFTVTFLTGTLFGAIRQGIIIPTFHLRRSQAEVIEMPFMITSTIFWARWLVLRYEVPQVAKIRIGVGVLAMGMLVVIEILGYFWLERGRKIEEDVGYWVGKGAFAVAVMLFGMMPWALTVIGC